MNTFRTFDFLATSTPVMIVQVGSIVPCSRTFPRRPVQAGQTAFTFVPVFEPLKTFGVTGGQALPIEI